MTADATLSVRSPADLIAAVPYLLGFHPVDSLTVVAMRGRRIVFAARHDLPEPGAPEAECRAEALHVATIVARHDVDGVTVIGHGPAARVTPAVLRLGDALTGLHVPLFDALRVTEGRYWSYLCEEPECCPPDGLPCDPSSSVIAAAATYAGQVAFPDRESLAAQLSPVDGADREAMAAATERAESRLRDLLSNLPDPEQSEPEQSEPEQSELEQSEPEQSEPEQSEPEQSEPEQSEPERSEVGKVAENRAIRRAGRAAVRDACRRHREGGQLTDDDVAWLGLLLTYLPVRDYAWERTDAADWQVALWSCVLRRVEPRYVPAPACLLGFAAWRAGHGALACVAVARALAADPSYNMAVLLDDVLRYALPPSAVDDWPVRRDGRRGRIARPRRRKRRIG